MGLSSASVSRTTKSCPARRPTARTSVGSMPGSACRPSSAPPLTARRSTTSSTVKPRTFPASTSSSTVVPSTPPAAGSGWRRARHPSTTVTKVPRTFTRPATTEGAPGIRVAPSRGRISRTRSASVAQRSWPTRKMSSRTTPASLIRSEEAKILQGVALSKQTRIGRRFRERRKQIGGPLGPQHDLLLRDRVGEREQRGVQQLSRGARLQPLGGAALAGGDASATSEGVVAVPHDRVPHMGEMHADLVRAAGAERDAQGTGVPEAGPAPPPRGPPLGRALRQRGAPPHEHVHERVVPVSRARVHHEARGLVEHREVRVFVDERQVAVRGGVAPGRRLVRRGELHGNEGAALELHGRAERPTGGGDALVGDEAGGDGAGKGELVREEAVEALGLRDGDAEGDGGHHGSAARASSPRGCCRPSSQRETASAIAPTVMAESATLNVGQRAAPMPTSTKSTTPWALRMRSTTFPTAPAQTSARANSRNRSPGRADRTIERSTSSAAM